jgi:uncharacterized protein (TIGR02598 family)
MAVAIVAFAFVALLGLIPYGLQTMREAIDTTVTAQIADRLVNDARQLDFDTLTRATSSGGQPSRPFRLGDPRYFDDQGSEVPEAERERAVYHAIVRVRPVTRVPAGGDQTIGLNDDLATITVQVAFNPNDIELEFVSGNSEDDPQAELIDPKLGLKLSNYGFLVARNETRNPKPSSN